MKTPKPLRKAIKARMSKERKEIMEAPYSRFPTMKSKKESIKRSKKFVKESIKDPVNQKTRSKKGKELLRGFGKAIGPFRGGYDVNKPGKSHPTVKQRMQSHR